MPWDVIVETGGARNILSVPMLLNGLIFIIVSLIGYYVRRLEKRLDREESMTQIAIARLAVLEAWHKSTHQRLARLEETLNGFSRRRMP